MKIVQKGMVEYQPTFEAMKAFNATRDEHTEDEYGWSSIRPSSRKGSQANRNTF